MALASVGNLGTFTSSTNNSTLSGSPAAQLDAGNIGILAISSDNTSTGADGDNGEVSSVTDSVGNTYTKLAEFTNTQGAAAAGVTVSLWFTRAAVTLTTGGTVTITFASNRTDKCASFWEFTTGQTIRVAASGSATLAEDGATDIGSLALSSLPSKQYLFFRAVAIEANSTTQLTVTSNYTAITAARSRNNAAAVLIRGEFRILTGTSSTSDPTLAVTGDKASVFVALEEATLATRSDSDSVGLSEGAAKQAQLPESDALSLSEAAAKQAGVVESDGITLTEQAQKSAQIIEADSAALSESLGSAVAGAVGTRLRFSFELFDDEVRRDLIGGAQNVQQSASDTVTLGEGLTKQVATGESDTLAPSENLGQTQVRQQAAADTVVLTEQQAKQAGVLENDGAALSETAAKQTSIGEADTLAPSENLAQTQVRQQAAADTVTLTEQQVKQAGVIEGDSAALSEAAAKQARTGESDTLAPSENLAAQQVNTSAGTRLRFSFELFDDEPRRDPLSLSGSYGQSVADTVGLSESLQSSYDLGAIQETFSLTESLAKVRLRSFSDALASSESLHGSYDLAPIAESFAMTETVTPQFVLGARGTRLRFSFELFDDEPRRDPGTGVDTYFHAAADSAGLSETLSKRPGKGAQDTLSPTELFVRAAARVIADTAALSEADAFSLARRLAEQPALSEQLTTISFPGGSLNLADQPTLSESLQVWKTIVAAQSDGSILSEQLVRQVMRSSVETLGFSEQVAARLAYALFETVAFAEDLTVTVGKGQGETIGLGEQSTLSQQGRFDWVEAGPRYQWLAAPALYALRESGRQYDFKETSRRV